MTDGKKCEKSEWRCCPPGKCAYRHLHPTANCPRENLPAATQQIETVPWVNDDLDGMVEALWRVIDAHYNTKQPFHNPVYADARMAHRILVGYLPYMKNAAIAQQKAK